VSKRLSDVYCNVIRYVLSKWYFSGLIFTVKAWVLMMFDIFCHLVQCVKISEVLKSCTYMSLLSHGNFDIKWINLQSYSSKDTYLSFL
jgi:hypothetical protein